ncbi:MAG TPA: glycoside hydrolase family 127 protein [Anaerohalosphaeraceae bacterium]|nr:glycoside hydrolase family 127 protein [Anaerohalosphaeraceae bacterium]
MQFNTKAVVLLLSCLLACRVYGTESFALEQVRLLDGPFKHAQDVNLKHLLQYDVDRLLAPYLKDAGLEPKGQSYPNWIGLDGHIGGHYLSAMAIYTAVTGNEECRRRMEYIVDELARCQKANGDGYVGGVPGGRAIWRQVAAGNPRAPHRAWVPWYNLHKTFAGLRDAWIYGGSEKAKSILTGLGDWCDTLLADYTPQQMEAMMDQEYGGMNEVLADLSRITGDDKYLKLARRFSHRQLLEPMSQGKDTLDNKHANTQVPKVVGFARIAELSPDKQFTDAARFFWDTVVHNRTLAFGGNSRREHFPSAEACTEFVEEREGPESCNTYNMLRLTEILHRMESKAEYADYYERALFNHILSTQHPDHGGYVYFTPARPRHYRVYSAPNEGMWCCVGTGMENHGQYGRFIYSHEAQALLVNLFIASELNWPEKGIHIRQETRFPQEPQTVLKVRADKPVRLTLKIRHPRWVPENKLQFELNGEALAVTSKPSSYASIERVWKDGDILKVTLPMHAELEPMPNVPDYAAILYGPIVLAAKTGTEDLQGLIADDDRWGHIAHGQLLPLDEAPMLVGDAASIAEKITPVNRPQLQFKVDEVVRPESFRSLVLEPFNQVHDARYMMYWRVVRPEAYAQIQTEMKAREQQRLMLDRQTVDRVIPGEQQPEADHNLQHKNSENGVHRNLHFRHVQAPGWFSYDLKVVPDVPLELYVLYWGRESGRRTFDIKVDGEKLVTENLTGKWNRDEFQAVRYPLPAGLVKEKKKITVTFEPHPGNYAGGLFDLRIVQGIIAGDTESSGKLKTSD